MSHYRCALTAIVTCLLFSDLPIAFAIDGCPAERTWTSAQDFQDGAGVRFRLREPDATPGRLEIIPPPPVYQGPPYAAGQGLFPFVHIACLHRGTIVRLDTNAADESTAIVGQYFTAPKNRSRTPSRTTVDLYGNVWCVHRQESDNGLGAVVRIATLIGGTRGTKNPDGSFTPDPPGANPPGEYLQAPFDYCSVGDSTLLDRRGTVQQDGSQTGDGLIHTSYGLGLTLGWDESQIGDNDGGGVSLAEDELIFSYTRIPGASASAGGAVAVDAHSDVWTGGFDIKRFQRLSGTFTPSVPGIADYIGPWFSKACGGGEAGGYGALVDFDGVLWSAQWGQNDSGVGLRYDPLLPDHANCTQQLYGLGLDPINGNIWASKGDVVGVWEIDRFTGRPVQMHNPATGYDEDHMVPVVAKGVAVKAQTVVNRNTQATRCESHVWTAGYEGGLTKISHLVPDPNTAKYDPNDPSHVAYTKIGSIDLPSATNRQLTGVSISTDGKVWVTDRENDTVWVIDPYPENQPYADDWNKVGVIDPRFPDGISLGNTNDDFFPYTYPDFSGYTGRLAALHGEWTVIHDGTMAGAKWGTVAWNTLGGDGCPADPEPGYTSLRVLVRASDQQGDLVDTAESLASHPWRPIQSNVPFYGVQGRYIQIKVVFAGRLTCDDYLTPTLCDLTVKPAYDPAEDCDSNGVPDACDILTRPDCNGNGKPDDPCDLPGNDADSNGQPDDCQVGTLYAGTNGGSGLGKVWRANGSVWTDLTPDGLGGASVVRTIARYRGQLYAGTQIGSNPATEGQVWRLTGSGWTAVGPVEVGESAVRPIAVLMAYADQLYAATDQGALWRARDPNGQNDWEMVGSAPNTEFRTATLGTFCGDTIESLYLGAAPGSIWRYDPARGLHEVVTGSARLQDFAVYATLLHAAAWASTGTTGLALQVDGACALNTLPSTPATWAYWAAETFGTDLYVGGGLGECQCLNCNADAMLWKYNGSTWTPVAAWAPRKQRGEGVSALAAQGDLALFIGRGQPSYNQSDGSGSAEVWRYDGLNPPAKVSPPNFIGSGVQTLFVVGGAIADCNGNGIPDAIDLNEPGADACANGILDVCEPNLDGDGIPDACDPDKDGDGIPEDDGSHSFPICHGGMTTDCYDNCPNTYNPGQEDTDNDGIGNTCDRLSIFDYDRDGDVDLDDYGVFQACYAGSGGTPADVGCLAKADTDCDEDVDGNDLAAFLSIFSGPDVPADPMPFDCDGNGWFNCVDECAGETCPEFTPQPDADGDGVPNAQDNCPFVANPNQADFDENGIGDACEGEGGSPLPDTDQDGVPDVADNCPSISNANQTDTDSDGVGDACDNCPTVANANQADWDADGIGNACDNCIWAANADQTDSDADGLGNACDNCPNDANAGQEDSDWDGIGDACETDDDNDGVADAQDNCPTAYNPDQIDSDSDGAGDECDTCPQVYDPGQTNQDGDWWQDACDNCPTVWNYYQQDGDQDGVGDVCDNCPDTYNPDQADTDLDGIGDACEGEGLMGMMMLSQSLTGLEPESNISASFVRHGTGELFVSLPPQGGTVVVDLVITGNEPISGFSVRPAVNASGVISVDASAWTQQANALFSLGDPNTVLSSYYDLSSLQWMVAIPSVAAQEQSPLPSGTGVATGRSLVQITGPYAGEVFGVADGLDLLAGPISVPTIGAFTTAAPMSGTLRYPVSNGSATVVTLTLQVAGVPGTYTLGVADGLGFTEAGEAAMTTGTLFTITVQSE